jgi:hypothetical protein
MAHSGEALRQKKKLSFIEKSLTRRVKNRWEIVSLSLCRPFVFERKTLSSNPLTFSPHSSPRSQRVPSLPEHIIFIHENIFFYHRMCMCLSEGREHTNLFSSPTIALLAEIFIHESARVGSECARHVRARKLHSPFGFIHCSLINHFGM